jgi:beta-glucanase (GH16 family)
MMNNQLIGLIFAGVVLLSACGGAAVVATPTPAAPPTPEPTATPATDRAGWTLIWNDEFDGPAINPDFWTHEVGGHGWGNGESQYYTDSPDNSYIEDGLLVIQALEQNLLGKLFTSARLITQEKVTQQYGRIEARIRIPTGQGIWPAFWMLGADFDTVGWPRSGEIDIMENIGSEPGVIHGTVHGPSYSGGSGVGASYRLPDRRPFADDFHVYAIEWEPQEIRWYVDDALYNTIIPDDLPGDWVFDHPFFILLNVAVGGRWPGYPDQTTEFPQRMLVDYVRIYERATEE